MGTEHNCQLADLAQEADGSTADIALRQQYLDDKYDTFLCAGHTAHSLEAGRVRRVCMGTYVRVFGKEVLTKLEKGLKIVNRYNTGTRDYTLFCMGKITMSNIVSLTALRNFFKSAAGNKCQTPSLSINVRTKMAMLSVCSGELLRKDINGTVISTTTITSSPWPDNKFVPEFPATDDPRMLSYYFSVFFQLIPYLVYDRPPRTPIASVQHIQAVASPYGVGTSSVQPTHISRPMVSTSLVEEIINDASAGMPDNMPGEDLVVGFLNHNATYEDCITLSKSSATRGLFNYMAYSSNVVNSTEQIPEISEMAHISTNRWWKTYNNKFVDNDISKRYIGKCANAKRSIDQVKLQSERGRHVHSEVDERGKVISKSVTTSGQISVKVLRYCMPAEGDKLATGHGQKGTLKLVEEEDMPYGIDDRGEVIKFDMIISLTSIASRLTEGQYYEMIAGVEAARQQRRLVISPEELSYGHPETVIYDGTTGLMVSRTDEDNLTGIVSENGDIPILASWGICRVWQMTQMTFDKQHYTHNTAGR